MVVILIGINASIMAATEALHLCCHLSKHKHPARTYTLVEINSHFYKLLGSEYASSWKGPGEPGICKWLVFFIDADEAYWWAKLQKLELFLILFKGNISKESTVAKTNNLCNLCLFQNICHFRELQAASVQSITVSFERKEPVVSVELSTLQGQALSRIFGMFGNSQQDQRTKLLPIFHLQYVCTESHTKSINKTISFFTSPSFSNSTSSSEAQTWNKCSGCCTNMGHRGHPS